MMHILNYRVRVKRHKGYFAAAVSGKGVTEAASMSTGRSGAQAVSLALYQASQHVGIKMDPYYKKHRHDWK